MGVVMYGHMGTCLWSMGEYFLPFNLLQAIKLKIANSYQANIPVP